jgi:membrane associated rhomboid family serine protease
MLYDREYMRDQSRSRWAGHALPDPVTLILIVNVAVFIAQHLFFIGADRIIVDREPVVHPWGALSLKALAEGRVWTVFTHMFVHENLMHLVGNGLLIYFAGKSVQSLLGPKQFLYIYFAGGVAGAAFQLGLDRVVGIPSEMIGASACGFSVFLALAVLLPQEVVTALVYFIIPVRVRLVNLARILVVMTIGGAVLQLFRVWHDHIAHFAHLGGAFAGWYIVRMLGYGGKTVTYDRLWRERLEREQSPQMASVATRRRVVDMDEPDNLIVPPVTTREFIEREIDPILDKIAAHGIASLTEQERRVLERAREQILSRDRT